MKTKIQVALNGVWFHDLNDSLIIQSFEEQPVQVDRQALARSGDGMNLTRESRKWCEMRLVFCIAEKRDYIARMQTMRTVVEWAKGGGELTTNYRSGQMMEVVLESLPSIGDARKWTNNYTIVFRAYGVPYWVTSTARSVSTLASSASLHLDPLGDVKTPVFVRAKNSTASTMKRFEMSANGYKMVYDGLEVASGQTFVLAYSNGVQSAYIASSNGSTVSVYSKRTVDSDDDVMIESGDNIITFVSDQMVDITLSARGRYL